MAVLSRNSHAFAALRFAVARIGAILVPINFMLNPDEINFILTNSGAKLLAVGPDFIGAARAATAKGCGVEQLVWLPAEDAAVAPAEMTTFDDCCAAMALRWKLRSTAAIPRRSSTPAGQNC